MFKIAIFGPIASGKSCLANALIDGAAKVDCRFSSELALVNRMVFGANDSFTIYPTNEAAEHGLGVMSIEKKAQSDFFQNIRTGILGYTEKDIAYVKTECPCKLLNLGVEIIDLPYSAINDYRQLFDILTNSDLIICCLNFNHGVSTNNHFSFLEHFEAPVLFVVTHFDYYRLVKELGNNHWNEIREVFSSGLRTFYAKYNDSQLFLLDPYLYIQGLQTNNLELIDRSRFLYLKAEIYRLVARTYNDRL